MTDYQVRFGVGKIALVCDRGLISEQNLADVAAAGFDHVLATWTSSRARQVEEALLPET
jgi:hypothetical protein